MYSILNKLLSKITLKYILIINLIFIFTHVLIQCFALNNKNINNPMPIILLSDIFLVFWIITLIYLSIKTEELKHTKQELELKNTHNKTLSNLNDNIRCLNHDINNLVQSIGGYISLNDMEGLRKYYNNMFEECTINNTLNILNPNIINNPSIYCLLTNKYYLASERAVKMNIHLTKPIGEINFNIYELTRILGILLDNAIEAAQITKEKFVEIEITSDAKKQIFRISNSCDNSIISTEKIFEKGFSTKDHNSGIGLWKVHNILTKRENANLFTTVKNNIFTQQLEIFY